MLARVVVTMGVALVAWVTSPVPVAAALAACGLVPAAWIDAREGRIPTWLAHGTTVVSLAALVVTAWERDEWRNVLLRALVGTGILVAVMALLWLAGWAGFGDVRLAAATMTAMVRGSGGPLVVLWVALTITGTFVIGRRWGPVNARAKGKTPFGPGLVAGWLAAVVAS